MQTNCIINIYTLYRRKLTFSHEVMVTTFRCFTATLRGVIPRITLVELILCFSRVTFWPVCQLRQPRTVAQRGCFAISVAPREVYTGYELFFHPPNLQYGKQHTTSIIVFPDNVYNLKHVFQYNC